MASDRTFKTTVRLPLGEVTGECTIQVPLEAFDYEYGETGDCEKQAAAFASKIMAAALKISRETTNAMFADAASASEDEREITLEFHFVDHQESFQANVKLNETLKPHLDIAVDHLGLLGKSFGMTLDGPNGLILSGFETPASVSY